MTEIPTCPNSAQGGSGYDLLPAPGEIVVGAIIDILSILLDIACRIES